MAFLQSGNTGANPGADEWHDLNRPRTVLGRHPDCNIVIDVGAVSRYHAHILSETGAILLEDLNSRNGTFVNDRQVQGRYALRDGDVVRICDTTFTFRLNKSTLPPTPPPPAPPSPMEESAFGTILVDDDQKQVSSTIMSKLDVATSKGRLLIGASAEVKLRALLDINSSLGKTLKLDEVLPSVIQGLFKIFVQADRGFIVLKSDDGKLIPRWKQMRRENSDETVRISKTICRQVMESKEAVLSADAASDSRFEMSQSIADFRIRSMMCAPLVNSEGEAFGVLQVDTLDQRNRFKAEDLEVLVAVAAQAGVAIDNAQLHERALRQRDIERDLQLAHQVQKGFLPHDRPQIPGYQFFNYYQPANHVGGDYFDYIALPDGRLAIVVADVVGHGIAAALLMAKLSAEARFSLASRATPKDAMTRLNSAICRAGVEDRFITCVLAVLNPQSHELTVVNAGHMAPLVRHPDGSTSEIGADLAGLPLGIVDGMDYEQASVTLAGGEWLAMYTDGINECTNPANEQYSIQRLRDHVGRSLDGPEQSGQLVVDDVRQYLDGGQQSDDMCLVCFGREDSGFDSSVLDEDTKSTVAPPELLAAQTSVGRG